MLKSIGTINLALATVFVVPAVTGQDGTAMTLEAQLDATISSLEYLAGLRNGVEAGDEGALRAVVTATETPRDASPQRATKLQTLRDDIARLRFTLDRMLADPREVAAITSLPPSVVRTLGLGGAAPMGPAPQGTASSSGSGSGTGPSEMAPVGPANPSTLPTWPTADPNRPAPSDSDSGGAGAGAGASANGSAAVGPGTPGATFDPLDPLGLETTDATNPYAARPDVLAGTTPTTGLGESMRSAISGELRPLDGVSDASRRRGDEPLDLEGDGYVADPIRLGKLLVRSGRPAEAIEVLEHAPRAAAQRYWLARAYQAQERMPEALEIFRLLKDDPKAGDFARYAAEDLKFLEFKRQLDRTGSRR